MANRLPKKCLHPSCSLLGTWSGGRCPEHLNLSVRERKKRHGFFDANWERFRQLLFGLGNVVCQRVDETGRRCTRPVYFFHHILETWERPDLALDWRNVVGVCVSCHPRPQDEDQGRYVPTMYSELGREMLQEIECQPGFVVPKGAELWDVENRRRVLPQVQKNVTGYGPPFYSAHAQTIVRGKSHNILK